MRCESLPIPKEPGFYLSNDDPAAHQRRWLRQPGLPTVGWTPRILIEVDENAPRSNGSCTVVSGQALEQVLLASLAVNGTHGKAAVLNDPK